MEPKDREYKIIIVGNEKLAERPGKRIFHDRARAEILKSRFPNGIRGFAYPGRDDENRFTPYRDTIVVMMTILGRRQEEGVYMAPAGMYGFSDALDRILEREPPRPTIQCTVAELAKSGRLYEGEREAADLSESLRRITDKMASGDKTHDHDELLLLYPVPFAFLAAPDPEGTVFSPESWGCIYTTTKKGVVGIEILG